MRKFIIIAVVALATVAVSCKKYETVAGDPLGTKIYTLDNGLKLYMSVNKEEPRIQTFIAVRVGGKNDPADNTGLAHYLEHIMFKGTDKLGTQDYEAEKPLLDQIQALYDVYRTKEDPAEREAIYHQIDSISYLASQISIANEYDKAMSIIGAKGTNAFTSDDVTCYTEDIPSNQVESWAIIQADRFKNMVVRGFHTELEAVYEEYNMSLSDDSEKMFDAVSQSLFPSHPYGTQTVIGTQQHLKNPDISAILRQKATYYVPNNCAICLSGDFDPDKMVKIIEKYFGDWEPNYDIPVLEIKEEAPIEEPIAKEVLGQNAEFVTLAWRYPGEKFPESELADVVGSVLYNGMAGLIDLDLNQQQKTLSAYGYTYGRTDHGELLLLGHPQEGQTLDQVKELLLAEVAKLCAGDFDEELVSATIANMKLDAMKSLERNASRAMQYVNSFICCHDWSYDALRLDRLSKVTKDDVVAWANEYLGQSNYAIVYKRVGTDPNDKKIEAPKITPIETNRDKQSEFLTAFAAREAAPIEPSFVDYSRDMSVSQLPGIEVLYKENTLNDIGSLSIVYDTGTLDDPALGVASDYIGYLGTPTRSAEEISKEMYSLACDFSLSIGTTQSSISVSGLDENLGKALEIVEDLILNARPDEEILSGLKDDVLKARAVNKTEQSSCMQRLLRYVQYGPEFISKTTLSNKALLALGSEELLTKIKSLLGYEHRVLYYGPASQDELLGLLSESNTTAEGLQPLEETIVLQQLTPEPVVYVANYEGRQFRYYQLKNAGKTFDPSQTARIELFNEYFGGSMNSIVFQEMREARALAYSANARYFTPSDLENGYLFNAFIASQNDKLQKAVEGFDDIINNMPQVEENLSIALTALDARYRTKRTTGAAVLRGFLACRKLGLSEPQDKAVFEALSTMTMEDVLAVKNEITSEGNYHYAILGDVKDMDMAYLKTLGSVKILSLEEIFGY